MTLYRINHPDCIYNIKICYIKMNKEPLNLMKCQFEILTNFSELLELVACEVSEAEAGAPFQVPSAPIKFPVMIRGN